MYTVGDRAKALGSFRLWGLVSDKWSPFLLHIFHNKAPGWVNFFSLGFRIQWTRAHFSQDCYPPRPRNQWYCWYAQLSVLATISKLLWPLSFQTYVIFVSLPLCLAVWNGTFYLSKDFFFLNISSSLTHCFVKCELVPQLIRQDENSLVFFLKFIFILKVFSSSVSVWAVTIF